MLQAKDYSSIYILLAKMRLMYGLYPLVEMIRICNASSSIYDKGCVLSSEIACIHAAKYVVNYTSGNV